jgi:4-amino-4-deoxy-L-arabinose transferase-like glycosyltransferase
LRWPLVLPMAGIIRLFGLNFDALMIPGILSFFAVTLVNYFGVRSVANDRAAFLAALGVMATPGFAYWASALYPDLMEATLWSAAFWCLWRATHAKERAAQTRAIIATGLITGLSLCVRETSIALAVGLAIASFFMPRQPLRIWIIAGASAAMLPVAEYAILWAVSGDPLYRLHIDMHHIAIPTDDMRGGAAVGQVAVLNTGIMERWAGAGPVHLHWLVDTYINFFLNIYYGLNFVALAVLGYWYGRRHRATDSVAVLSDRVARGLIPALVALAAANIVWNLYILALNPSDRMFMPSTIAAAIIVAVLADRLWPVRGARRLVWVLMAVKIASTVIIADTIPNYRNGARAAERIAPRQGAVHATWQTHSQLVFASSELRQRLDMRPAMPGAYLILYSNKGAWFTEHLLPGRWRLVRSGYAGHQPWTIRGLNALFHGLGLDFTIPFADVEVRLFQRLPGPPLDPPVIIGADGKALPPDAYSER